MDDNIIVKITSESDLSAAQLDLQETVERAQDLEEEYGILNSRMRDVAKTAGKGSDEYKELNRQAQLNRKSINELTKGVKLTNLSMNALRARANNLREALDNTSMAANPKKYAELQRQLEKTEDAMGKLGKASVASRAKQAIGMKVAGAAAAAYFALRNVIRGAFDTIVEFDKANATLASVLGSTQKEIKDLTDDAMRLGAATSYTASQMTELQTELAKLGFSKQEILQSTEAVQRFATATGADLANAAALAGASLRAFNLDAKEMERAVSTMAVATTKSALDFGALDSAMSNIAPVAYSFGFTIEDTTALLGTLANSGFDASSAATATRNILLNLADANGKLAQALGRPIKSMDDLIPAMRDLQARGVDLGEALELTNKQSVSAFNTFLSGVDSLEQLRDAITDCSEELKAMEQERLDTVSGKIDLMKSAWDGLMLTMSGSKGVMKDVIGWITSITEKTNEFVAQGGFKTWFASTFGPEEVKKEIALNKEAMKERKKQDEELLNFQKLGIEEARALNDQKIREEEDYQQDLRTKIDQAYTNGDEDLMKYYMMQMQIIEEYRQKRSDTLEQMELDELKRQDDAEKKKVEDERKAAKARLERLKKDRAVLLQQEQNKLTNMQLKKPVTDTDYAGIVEQSKKVAELEAQVRIDSLNKMELGEKAYKAQVESIRLELQKNLAQIDKEEEDRKFNAQQEQQKRLLDLDVTFAQKEVDALTGAEGAEAQKRAYNDLYNAKKEQLDKQAQLEIDAVNRSTDTEEVKKTKIDAINQQLNADLVSLKKENNANLIAVDEQYVSDLQRTLTKAQDAVDQSQGLGKIDALANRLDAENALYDEQERILNDKWATQQISYQDYQDQMLEITRNRNQAEITYEQEKMQVITEGFQQALDYMQQFADVAFDIIGSQIQAEMDALDEEYTTDAEEAAKNSKKKLITEEEYEKKRAELQLRQQKLAKAQALFTAGINTAMAVTSALATQPFVPLGLAMAVLAGALGAAQIAAIAAKPLSQYAKGRKGGQGEYALVGERGAEIMYVPEGASIIPHNKIGDQSAWGDYGVPRLTIPELPSTNMVTSSTEQQIIPLIDYDRLGEAVASRMPEHKSVSVHVDGAGVTVQEGNYTHTYRNRKYAGSWS